MAKYRSSGVLYVGGHLIQPGAEFESDDVPGKAWIPLDEPAEKAHKAKFPTKDSTKPLEDPTVSDARKALQGVVEERNKLTNPPAEKPVPAAKPASDEDEDEVPEPKEVPEDVDIPKDWADLPSQDVIDLSRRLGAPRNNKYTAALAYIKKVEAKRKES